MCLAVAVVIFVILLNLFFLRTAHITLPLLLPVLVVFLIAVRESTRTKQ